MVDATARISASSPVPAGETARPGSTPATLRPADYAGFASGTAVAPAQTPEWVAGWSVQRPDATLILHVEDAGTRIALPLEIVGTGPLRVARFMGGSHANGNFPAAHGAGRVSPRAIAQAARASGHRIDLIHLERLADQIAGVANPLGHLPRSESPNVALAVDLVGGFEALLGRTSGKRKRKKHRSQTRKYEAAGGHRRLQASTNEDVDRILDAFFAMKSDRFGRAGIRDVFAEPHVQAFFRGLFKGELGRHEPAFVLHALEVGGVLRAVTGSSRCGDRLICEFGAIREDDLAHTSPGDFLFFDNIQEACGQGFGTYDFSVGDEFYKRLWCNIEIRQFDIFVPVTSAGRALALGLAAQSRAKRFVKNNRLVWSIVKRLRRQRVQAVIADEPD